MRMMFCLISHMSYEDKPAIHPEDPPYDWRDIPEPLPQRWKVPVPAPIKLNEPQWLKEIYDGYEVVEYELHNTESFGRVYIRVGNRSFKEILARNPFYFLREKAAAAMASEQLPPWYDDDGLVKRGWRNAEGERQSEVRKPAELVNELQTALAAANARADEYQKAHEAIAATTPTVTMLQFDLQQATARAEALQARLEGDALPLDKIIQAHIKTVEAERDTQRERAEAAERERNRQWDDAQAARDALLRAEADRDEAVGLLREEAGRLRIMRSAVGLIPSEDDWLTKADAFLARLPSATEGS